MTGTAAIVGAESDTLNAVEHIKPLHRRMLDILPGVSGGMARVLVGQPFDTLKTRMQVLGAGTPGAVGMPPDMVYNSNMDCLRKMVKAEGPGALYKGTVAPLLGNMVLLGIHFPVFAKVRAILEDRDGVEHESATHHQHKKEFSAYRVLLAGAAAGAAGSIVSSPSELVRTKMQMQRKVMLKQAMLTKAGGAGAAGAQLEEVYTGNLDCFKKILRRHGIRGLFQGYASTLARDMQGYAWFFLGYEATIHWFLDNLRQHSPEATKADLSFLEVMGAGIMAGFGLWGSMFPIDTIKSRVQADSLANPEYKGTMDCVNKALKTEGAMGLWRGVGVALLRAIPVNAAIFVAVEGTRMLIERESDFDFDFGSSAVPLETVSPAPAGNTAAAS